jgi:hypothetical protein
MSTPTVDSAANVLADPSAYADEPHGRDTNRSVPYTDSKV